MQARRRAEALAGGNRNGAAKVGSSNHEGGFAVDVQGVYTEWFDKKGNRHTKLTPLGELIKPIFERHGFKWKGHGDPPHFEADFRLGGYKSVQEANKSAEDYYENCIKGKQ